MTKSNRNHNGKKKIFIGIELHPFQHSLHTVHQFFISEPNGAVASEGMAEVMVLVTEMMHFNFGLFHQVKCYFYSAITKVMSQHSINFIINNCIMKTKLSTMMKHYDGGEEKLPFMRKKRRSRPQPWVCGQLPSF